MEPGSDDKGVKKLSRREKKQVSQRLAEEIGQLRAQLESFCLATNTKRRPGTPWQYHDLNSEQKSPPPIIFLPGGSLRPEAYFLLLRSLAHERRVLAVCWPQGDAQFNDMEDYSAGIELIMTYANIPKAHIIGLGFGGFVAQHFSNHYPSFVLSLIIIHSSPPNEDLAECFRPYSRVKDNQKVESTPSVTRYFPGWGEKEKDLASAAQDVTDQDSEFWHIVLKTFGVAKDKEGHLLLPRLQAAGTFLMSISSSPPPSTFPVLVCDGDGEDLTPQWKKYYPKASFLRYPGAAHLYPLLRGKLLGGQINMMFLSPSPSQ